MLSRCYAITLESAEEQVLYGQDISVTRQVACEEGFLFPVVYSFFLSSEEHIILPRKRLMLSSRNSGGKVLEGRCIWIPS